MEKHWIRRHLLRQENAIYIVSWGLLFAAPLLSMYLRTAGNPYSHFEWRDVCIAWQSFLLFLLLFLVHNFLLAPLIICRHKPLAYFSSALVLIIAFALYQYNNKPPRPGDMPPHRAAPPPHRFVRKAPPPITGEHDIKAVLMLMLVFAANLGVKSYSRSQEDRKRLSELERQNLEHQLEYLRYQIRPHFFMNTLNNIHALVSVDPEKARHTIVELSKLMRYVLYEGNRQSVRVSQEFEFIRHYVSLMQLRYAESVQIRLDLPRDTPERQMPPLILITFIENAFKHGISYRHDSFIDVRVAVEDEKLCLTCRNSKAENPNKEKGGMGLANVRGRLDLLYGTNYTLRVRDDADTYSVELNIPLS